jgi:hypothetical protein
MVVKFLKKTRQENEEILSTVIIREQSCFAKNLEFHSKTKHIQMRYDHFI